MLIGEVWGKVKCKMNRRKENSLAYIKMIIIKYMSHRRKLICFQNVTVFNIVCELLVTCFITCISKCAFQENGFVKDFYKE